jgi:hypothetical protein
MNTPHAEWSEQEKEAQRGRMRRWRAAHPDKVQESNERAQAKRTEQYRTDAVYRERVKAASRLTAPSVQRERRARLKAQVFDHYGRVCACCGETEPLFLTLGHTKGDGAAHRNAVNGGKRGGRRAGGMTAAVYNDIIKRGFPNDLRIECYNCNCGAFRNGNVCPHAKMKQDAIA